MVHKELEINNENCSFVGKEESKAIARKIKNHIDQYKRRLQKIRK